MVELPVLAVTSPDRGAFFPSGAMVQVAGTASRGTHALQRLLVNGEEIPLEGDGSFSVMLTPDPGVNVLGLRLEDVGGERTVDGRAFYAEASHDSGDTIQDAVWMQLGPELLDDDQPDLDDLSGVLEVVLLDPAVADTLVGERFVTEDGIELEPTALSIQGADVDLTPANGRINAEITLHDVWMDFNAAYSFYSTTGSAWMDQIVLTMGIEAQVSGRGVQAEVVDAEATLVGYGLTVDWFPDWLEDDLADWTKETLEESLVDSVQDMAGEALGGVLSAFAVQYEVAEGVELGLELSGISSDRDGLYMTFDAWSKGSGLSLPSGAGSLGTSASGPEFPLSDRPFAVALDDDLVNQVFFAFWASGAVDHLTYGVLELAFLVGEPLPPPLGPVAQVVIDLGMPPSVHAGEGELPFVVRLGELTMDITREDGVRTMASLNFAADADVALDDEGALVVTLDDRPKYVPVEAGILESPEGLDPGDLASLFRLMTPTLVGSMSDLIPSFQLPPLPLDAMGDIDALEGATMVGSDATLGLESGGWFLLEADLVAGD